MTRKWIGSCVENMLYAGLWLLLLITPVLSFYIRNHSTGVFFSWSWCWHVWRVYLFFFVGFLIHNFLLAPLLVYQHRRALYLLCTTLLVVLFTWIEHVACPTETTFMLRETEISGGVFLVLMFGANDAVKMYFRARQHDVELQQLKLEAQQEEIAYLRYQINPHFLMNTLNNIHALVEIDPPRAQETIVQLSALLRHMLYEGSKKTTLLSKEIDFLKSYVQLMRLRYPDEVEIQMTVPADAGSWHIPPLLFVNFVENAFKHGVSYDQKSFIHVHLGIDGDRLLFSCVNVKHPKPNPAGNGGGIGLKNVRKRLDLLYGSDYQLKIDDGDTLYRVALNIPLTMGKISNKNAEI